MRFLLFYLLSIPSLVCSHLFHRDEEFTKNVPIYAARTPEQLSNDSHLVGRIISAYQLAEKKHLGDSIWQLFYDQKLKDIHTVFQAGDFQAAQQILRNPSHNELFYGIDCLCSSVLPLQLTYEGLVLAATQSLDTLVRLGEAIGAIKLDYVEFSQRMIRKWHANEMVEKIEAKLGITIPFPNPYADEVGIYTSRGTASLRAIYAIYQAHRIKELLKDIPNPRVLEIGAGLGRTAYYCRQFGIKDYTIIDIPMTALASSYFLGRTLGEDQIVLLGESMDDSRDKVKIFTPDQFFNDTSYYDLIINVDSLTEMNVDTMNLYLKKIQTVTPQFISINGELNSYSVFELLSNSPKIKSFYRLPYWMRLGFTEELYIFNQ